MIANVYKFCFSKGIGSSKLDSFDDALYSAGIGNCNIIKISSILPPNCLKVDELILESGQYLHCAYVTEFCTKKGVTLSVAIGLAIPKNKNQPGIIMEFSNKCTEMEAKTIVEKMCHKSMLRRSIEKYDILIESYECQAKDEFTCLFGGLILNEQ